LPKIRFHPATSSFSSPLNSFSFSLGLVGGAGPITGKLNQTWGEIALKTQLLLDACLESARTGGTLVSLELRLSGITG
jgi:hypothetical protein